jgi:hypothetical protein
MTGQAGLGLTTKQRIQCGADPHTNKHRADKKDGATAAEGERGQRRAKAIRPGPDRRRKIPHPEQRPIDLFLGGYLSDERRAMLRTIVYPN